MLLQNISKELKNIFNLKADQENELETYNEVKTGAIFKGTNFWVMAFAMLISCIGLNINSKAAVIGAMIISPLMGPIFGIGFSLATSDIALLKLSFKNYITIVIFCLFFSTLYYLLSPYHIATDELISFSRPTIFDILLALFGGMAGFIAISRADGNRVLVGVAVATACIPPLCTVGFGIATAQFNYVWGGMYTYLINCLFICIGTYIIAKYLRFKKVKNEELKSINSYFTVLSILFILPALYFAVGMAQENIYKSKVDDLIKNKLEEKFHVISYKVDASNKNITLDVLSKKFDKNIDKDIENILKSEGLNTTKLKVYQSVEANYEATSDEINILKKEIQDLKNQINKK
jgi:uncharacterized hydrophobic protein (TIGR00271 family)